jgi:3-oxoacyl-[acyl-carrier protein] reductase
MNIRFDGQTIAVSGAASAFGRAIATQFVALGGKVFGCDVSADAVNTLTSAGAVFDAVDLSDRAAAAAWIHSVEERSGAAIDVLVHNAGGVAGQTYQPLEDVADEDWDRVLDINLGAAFALSRAATPAMKRAGKGSITNISSIAALQPSLTGIQAYCAAKHALLGLTRQLAHELGPFGIRVNSVAPGFVRTEASERQWASYSPDKQRALIESIAMHRLGTAEEIAKAVLFFASDLASFVNGQILTVDGGH